MAASMVRRVLQISSTFQFQSKIPLFSYRRFLQSTKPQTVTWRTVTQSKMDINRKIFHKRIFQFAALLGFLIYVTPYARSLQTSKFEPRRDKKRRKLQALKEAEDHKNSGFQDIESSSPDELMQEEEGGNILPVVKAAKVVDEGDGYMPPRSHRFNFIADAVEIAAPSVVYIEIQGRHPMLGNQQIALANGSGFIVSSDGLILTNAHVVANKIQGRQVVKIRLDGGRTVSGRVIAVDPVSDLAAVKIDDGNNHPVMKLGKSARVRPGEWVIAMGSPLSLSNTITAGIISTVNRKSKELGLNKAIDYIQTDAAINVGNSGGPLVNLDGEAIGINTLKITAGISFAIPIDDARIFLEKVQQMKEEDSSKPWSGWFSGGGQKLSPIEEGGKRGYLGVTMLSLNQSLLNDLKSKMADFPNVTHGVLVYRITTGSPAQTGGMKAGDIITHIDNKPVKSATGVYNAVHSQRKMDVIIVRGAETLKLTLVPEDIQ